MRVSALRALVRLVRVLLSADRRRPRLHAAAGPAGDRRLRAADLAGPLRRRELAPGHAPRISPGRRWCSSAACTCNAPQIEDIRRRAHALDRVAVLGGSSVSACPEYYPDFDYLHVGELGDATDELIDAACARRFAAAAAGRARPRASAASSPSFRCRPTSWRSSTAISSAASSSPAAAPINASSAISPRSTAAVPRFKTPEQVTAELDKMLACGLPDAVYFVDDNFIAPPARRARAAAAPDRVAEAQRLSVLVRLRGDAQHRQAAGNSRR